MNASRHYPHATPFAGAERTFARVETLMQVAGIKPVPQEERRVLLQNWPLKCRFGFMSAWEEELDGYGLMMIEIYDEDKQTIAKLKAMKRHCIRIPSELAPHDLGNCSTYLVSIFSKGEEPAWPASEALQRIARRINEHCQFPCRYL